MSKDIITQKILIDRDFSDSMGKNQPASRFTWENRMLEHAHLCRKSEELVSQIG